MNPTTTTGLTQAQLETAFPFHVALDVEQRICRSGASIRRLLPGLHGSRFDARFRLVRPRATGNPVERLATFTGHLVVLETCTEPRLQLRGSVQHVEGEPGLLLLLSPWVTRLQDIETLGLTLADFAPHDPVIDLLFLQQANVAALEDTRRLADKLAERTESLDSISSLSPDGVVLFSRDGRITYVNPAFARMFGRDPSYFFDMSEATFGHFVAACAGTPHDSPDFSGVPQPGEPHEPERRATPRTAIHLEEPEKRILSCSVRREEGGSKVLYFRDVTRETEVDRMKSEFLSTAAHELRTPMASVFGFSELLLKRNFDEATRTELLGTIHRQAGALIHLLNELLDLARIEARAGKDFKIQVQPVRPILDNTVRALLVPNDPRKVEVDLPDELPHCAVDAEKLQQALTNLLSNAYKYSPGGGEIRLDTLTDDAGSRIGIRVTDHGIGMTPEQVARCFERFYRADASGNIPGTGLGLALVKEIVEIFGGSVEVRSRYGEGTACTLWLPIPSARPQLAA